MCICHVTIVLWHAVMYPELKLPCLRLVAPVVGFRKPSAIDAQTSRRGPRRSMKNRDTPAHPQVYYALRQGSGPRVHDDLGTLSPYPCLFGGRRRRDAPLRSSPTSPSQASRCPCQCPRARCLGLGRLRLVVPQNSAAVKQSALKRLKDWRFLPRLKRVGFRASRRALVIGWA